jgi:hypothetical protein
MKNNLIFTNLAEQPTEDVEIKLRTFIFEKLGIEKNPHLLEYISSSINLLRINVDSIILFMHQ